MSNKSGGRTQTYITRFVLIIMILCSIGLLSWGIITLIKANNSLTKENENLINQMDSLITDVKSIKILIEEGDITKENNVSIVLPKEIEQEANVKTIESVYSMMQGQYESFLSNFTIGITIMSILIAIIVVIVPIFNYLFLQRDTLISFKKSMEELHDNKKEELDKLIQENKDEVKENGELILLQQKVQAALTSEDINDLTFNLKQENNIAYAYFMIAQVYLKRNLYDKVIYFMRKSIRINKNNSSSYFILGNAFSKKPQPNFEEAIKNYEKAIKLNGSIASYYNNLGAVLIDKAESDSEKAISIYEEAIKNYKKALKINDTNASVYNNLADAYIILSKISNKEENLSNAKVNIDKALLLEGNIKIIYCTLAEYFDAMGEGYEEDKLEACRKAKEIDSNCLENCSLK